MVSGRGREDRPSYRLTGELGLDAQRNGFVLSLFDQNHIRVL